MKLGKISLYLFILVATLGAFYNFSHVDEGLRVLLTMKDLGYAESNVDYVNLKDYGTVGELYQLHISCEDQSVKIEYYCFKDVEDAKQHFKNQVTQRKKQEQKSLGQSVGESIASVGLSYDELVVMMQELDAKTWNCDMCYAMYDYNDYPKTHLDRNTLFFLKENRVLIMEVHDDFEMTPERIKKLSKLIDQEQLFLLKQ